MALRPPSSGTFVDTYSTAEVATSKVWTNGKTIYRKVVVLGALPNNTVKNVAHGLAAGVVFTHVEGLAAGMPLPFAHKVASYSIAVYVDAMNVGVDTGMDRTGITDGIVVLEYTKP